MIERNEGAKGAIIVDARYLPLIVSSFVGEVELAQGLWYEEVVQRLIWAEAQRGRRSLNVHDAVRATRTSPEMRKFWADMSARNTATMEARMAGNFIVVASPLLRGVITAVGWLNPKVAKLKVFGNLDTAVSAAVLVLDGLGTPVALPAEGYRSAVADHGGAHR
jgi:hypothetical protein